MTQIESSMKLSPSIWFRNSRSGEVVVDANKERRTQKKRTTNFSTEPMVLQKSVSLQHFFLFRQRTDMPLRADA